MKANTDATVLIADDNRNLADLFTERLSNSYTVRTAYGGEEALTKLDASVDVVLLDRRMPDIAGEEVLTTIREREFDCQVALVTSVAMDYDSLPLGFDDYLRKPVSECSLHVLVESLLIRREYSANLQEYFALVSKRVALQCEKEADEFATHPQVRKLDDRIAELREEIDGVLEDLSESEYRALFASLAVGNSSDASVQALG